MDEDNIIVKDVMSDATVDCGSSMCYDDIVSKKIRTNLEFALNSKNLFTKEIFEKLQYIVAVYYQYKDNQKKLDEIALILVEYGISKLYIKTWDEFHKNASAFYADLKSDPVNIFLLIEIIWWNYSDKCDAIAESAYEHNVIEYLLKNLSVEQLAVGNLDNNRIRYLVKGTLGILHNCLRNCPKNKNLVVKYNGFGMIQSYYQSQYLIIKAKVLIVMSYCVNDDEGDKLLLGPGVMQFIVQLLKSALESENHLANKYGFSALETVEAICKIANNDGNKKLILESDLLGLVIEMLDMKRFNQSEIQIAVICIWTLGFHPDSKKSFDKFPDLVHEIKDRKEKTLDSKTMQACEGILLILNPPNRKALAVGHHVMLSYQWDEQETMLKVRDFLRLKNFEVWMDVDKMKHSMLECMAEAIEQSAVVVIALTEAYKNSKNCRAEADYAFQMGKPMIFLMMQQDYKPTGWLGLLLGGNLYYDLSNEKNYAANIENMAIGVKEHFNKLETQNPQASSKKVDDWTKADVLKWINTIKPAKGKNELEEYFEDFDGAMLLELARELDNPNYSVNKLKQEAGVTEKQWLCLSTSLKKLVAERQTSTKGNQT